MMAIKHCETTITTERLLLAPMLASDAAVMFPILSDRQLYSFTGEEPPASEEVLAARYRKLESRKSPDGSQQWLNWVVSLEKSSVATGYVQATVSTSYAEIAWVIGSKWQGSGYASEAAAALVKWLLANGVTGIRCCIHPDHIASQRVAANAGFHKSSLVEDGEDVWLL
jgi:RimJ/RimL family protein N-acetyltransferase